MSLTSQQMIEQECEHLKDLLLSKNRKYGDSAIHPKRIFSTASPVEQIKVRIDDKLSRLMSSQVDDDEDVILDLLGYLILLRVAQRKVREADLLDKKSKVVLDELSNTDWPEYRMDIVGQNGNDGLHYD
jgi:hypothetical protein